MRTVIVGCGRVGAGLAERLAREGHDVTIIDVNTEAFSRLEPDFPGQAIRADGTDEDVLRRVGTDTADWFFALTEGDNRNAFAAQMANETSRINSPRRALLTAEKPWISWTRSRNGSCSKRRPAIQPGSGRSEPRCART